MSFKIQMPPGAHLSAADPEDKQAKDAAKVGKDFEAIFLRQMLSQANVAGKNKERAGYADMAVESLATSITAAGGLGMGRAIEQSLLAVDARTKSGGAPLRGIADAEHRTHPDPHAPAKKHEPPQVPPKPAVRTG